MTDFFSGDRLTISQWMQKNMPGYVLYAAFSIISQAFCGRFQGQNRLYSSKINITTLSNLKFLKTNSVQTLNIVLINKYLYRDAIPLTSYITLLKINKGFILSYKLNTVKLKIKSLTYWKT